MRTWGSRDRKKKIPSAPGWTPGYMSGEDVVRWAKWAGVRLHLIEGGVNPTWDGPTPYRILGSLVPHREQIVAYLQGTEEEHPFL